MEITVDIPAPLSRQSTEELARRARLLVVIDEVRGGRLTRPGAARALEMTLDDFLIQAPTVSYPRHRQSNHVG